MPPTFAHRLRLIPHRSLLLERARRAGLDGATGFVALAWQRGCRYYPRGAGEVPSGCVSFSNEELAIALMHPSLPWDPQRLRVAAAMAGAWGNDCRRLARLAVQEQAVVPLAMVARAGREAEPGNPFWSDLLRCLPEAPPPPPGVMPHPSRFCAIAGKTRPGPDPSPSVTWIRPNPAAAPRMP